jgi:DNA-binding MarR family transcriptional regulator
MTGKATHERLGHLLNKACRLRHQRMHESLGDLGLYKGQPSMLRALWAQDGVTQSELAALLNRCPSTITKTVKRMEKAGFVERRPDPRDERVSRVCLTEAGRNTQTALEDVWRTFEEQAFDGFDEQEMATFRDFLIRVCQNIKAEIS